MTRGALDGMRWSSREVRAAQALEFAALTSPHGVVLHVREVLGSSALCGAGVPASPNLAHGPRRGDVPHLLVCFSCRSVYEEAFGRALPEALE